MNIRGGKKQRPALRVKAIKVTRYAVVDRHDQVVGNRLYHIEEDAETFLHYLLRRQRGTQRKPQQITGNRSVASEALSHTNAFPMSVGLQHTSESQQQRGNPTFTPNTMPGQPPSEPTPHNNPIDRHVNDVTTWMQRQEPDTLVNLLNADTTTPWEKDIARGILGITPDQCPTCGHPKQEHSYAGCHKVIQDESGSHFCECNEKHPIRDGESTDATL